MNDVIITTNGKEFFIEFLNQNCALGGFLTERRAKNYIKKSGYYNLINN